MTDEQFKEIIRYLKGIHEQVELINGEIGSISSKLNVEFTNSSIDVSRKLNDIITLLND